MPLEDPSVIDIIARPAPGKVALVITDAGITTDPDQRYRKLIEKAATYLEYAFGPDFRKDFPELAPADASILVLCRLPPTPPMQALDRVTLAADPTKGLGVTFQLFPGSG
ncbi:MAG TPA: hypothetical protein VF017_12235 [Thermoanaerobaculia bacterium]|nr:hypothetical protein [Thermoanaerobaculia bacterium]